MELKLGIICDSANVAEGAKLNILGEFNTIFAPKAPVGLATLTLVARIEAPIVEGTDHELQLDVTNEDGQSILNERLIGPIRMVPQGPGRPLRAQIIVQAQTMGFPEFGDYEFHIIVDKRSIGTVPPSYVHRDPRSSTRGLVTPDSVSAGPRSSCRT